MEEATKRRKTTTRSETVSVRLEPRLRYLADLGARTQRRTVSSFIEWCVQNSLAHVSIGSGSAARTIEEQAGLLWDPEPADRFVTLALHFEFLLNHDEQALWKLIREQRAFWKGGNRPESPVDIRDKQEFERFANEYGLSRTIAPTKTPIPNLEKIRAAWPTLVAEAQNKAKGGAADVCHI